jgi:RNA polymerase sigma-70 factor (ECF subfamily)
LSPAEKPNAEELRVDSARVAALYIEHADDLRRLLNGILRNSELAAEALQAAFVKAVEVGHTAKQETLKAWLFRVAVNEALVIKRRQKVDGEAIRRVAWSQSKNDSLPDDRLVRWETVEAVRLAMEGLPPEQRQVVRMRVYENKTFAVIANELGTPLSTVLSRMQLALRKLRGKLDK